MKTNYRPWQVFTLSIFCLLVTPTGVSGETQQTFAGQEETLLSLTTQADKGDDFAALRVGLIWLLGFDVESDDKIAFKYLSQAAEAGLPEAQNQIGILYFESRGVQNPNQIFGNYRRGVKWFKRAADNGYAPAQFNLAQRYRAGRGVSENPSEAVKYFRLAAGAGLPEAQYAMAMALWGGYGHPVDKAKSQEWLCLSGSKGYGPAIQLIAEAKLQCIARPSVSHPSESDFDFQRDVVLKPQQESIKTEAIGKVREYALLTIAADNGSETAIAELAIKRQELSSDEKYDALLLAKSIVLENLD